MSLSFHTNCAASSSCNSASVAIVILRCSRCCVCVCVGRITQRLVQLLAGTLVVSYCPDIMRSYLRTILTNSPFRQLSQAHQLVSFTIFHSQFQAAQQKRRTQQLLALRWAHGTASVTRVHPTSLDR